MSCEGTRELVSAFLDGALPDDQRAEVERHLFSCPTCREYRDELASVIELVRDLPPAPELSPLREEVLSRIRKRRGARILSWLVPLTAAACVILLATLAGREPEPVAGPEVAKLEKPVGREGAESGVRNSGVGDSGVRNSAPAGSGFAQPAAGGGRAAVAAGATRATDAFKDGEADDEANAAPAAESSRLERARMPAATPRAVTRDGTPREVPAGGKSAGGSAEGGRDEGGRDEGGRDEGGRDEGGRDEGGSPERGGNGDGSPERGGPGNGRAELEGALAAAAPAPPESTPDDALAGERRHLETSSPKPSPDPGADRDVMDSLLAEADPSDAAPVERSYVVRGANPDAAAGVLLAEAAQLKLRRARRDAETRVTTAFSAASEDPAENAKRGEEDETTASESVRAAFPETVELGRDGTPTSVSLCLTESDVAYLERVMAGRPGVSMVRVNGHDSIEGSVTADARESRPQPDAPLPPGGPEVPPDAREAPGPRPSETEELARETKKIPGGSGWEEETAEAGTGAGGTPASGGGGGGARIDVTEASARGGLAGEPVAADRHRGDHPVRVRILFR